MAQKTLREFSAPGLENIPTGPRFAVEKGAPEFKEDQRAIETTYKYQPTSSQPNSKGMNSGNTSKQLSLKEIIDQQTKTNDEVKQRLDTNELSLKDIYNKMDFLLTAFDEQNTLNKRVELKLIKLAACTACCY